MMKTENNMNEDISCILLEKEYEGISFGKMNIRWVGKTSLLGLFLSIIV